ncbi:MAG: hypothetical protein IT176_12710 [Acidobacteria bacterium]|nr:hypothetical protein [Acidobacteriota bacterium]
MVLGVVLTVVAAGTLHAQTPEAAPPAQAQPAAAPAFPSAQAGLVLNFIKPDKTADFEEVMNKVKEALNTSENPTRKQQAAGWRVYKSPDPAGPNVLYVFIIDPAVPGADYTVSNILAEAFPTEAQALYDKYAACYAMGLNRVNLNLLIDMGK